MTCSGSSRPSTGQPPKDRSLPQRYSPVYCRMIENRMSGEEEETLRHVNREKRRRNCDRGDEMESSDCSVGTWLRDLKFNVIVLFYDIISRHHFTTSHHITFEREWSGNGNGIKTASRRTAESSTRGKEEC